MDAADYLKILRRRWWALLLCVVAGVVGGYGTGHARVASYRATSQVYVSVPINGTVFEQVSGAELSSLYLSTFADVVTSQAVVERIRTTLHLPVGAGVSLSAQPVTNTFLINISATDPDPVRAAAVANAAAAALHNIGGTLDTNTAGVKISTIQQAGVPGSPTGSGPSKDLILGTVLGLVAGFSLVALLEVLDRTVKSGPQATALTSSPLLGLLPRRRGGIPAALQDGGYDVSSEAYRALRTSVRFLDPDRPLRTILVTSPSPGDGKTTTAANLAIALSRGGERVIVVDCDLRRAGLGAYFGLESAVGVTTILRRQVRLRDALQQWSPNLSVLPAGALPPNPAELLGSQAMASLLDQLALEADVVVIDAPPVLPVTDGVVLATQVDGVLLVIRYGKTLRNAVSEAVRRLRSVDAPVSGAILNGMPASEAREYYVEYVYQDVPLPKRPAPGPDRADDAPVRSGLRSD